MEDYLFLARIPVTQEAWSCSPCIQ